MYPPPQIPVAAATSPNHYLALVHFTDFAIGKLKGFVVWAGERRIEPNTAYDWQADI